MDLPNWFQALPFILLKFLNWYLHFFNQAWPYILLLLLDPLFSHFFNIEKLGEFYPFRPRATNLLFLGSDDYKRSVILNLSDEDERGAIVYVVNADTSMEQFSEAREDLRDLLSDEDFINVPFLIFCETPEPSYPSEKELCFLLGLTDKTTGKGRVKLQAGTNARPLEVFVAEPSNRKQHQDAIKWLSQYIKKAEHLLSLQTKGGQHLVLRPGYDLQTVSDFEPLRRQSISRNEMSSNTTRASYLTSWESCIGKIKFNFYDLGSHWIARRVWRDYSAKMDAVVYIVNANTKTREQFSGPREELNALLSDEAFANVPFLIFCITAEPSSCPEEELCSLLNLTNITTGKGRVDLAVANARPLEVFVAESYNKKQYLDGFKWLSKYIKDTENRKEKERKKDGFAQQSSSFALYFIDFAEMSIPWNETSQYLTSCVSSIGGIKFNFFDLGEHSIARRVWRDYCAKMDAVVYIVNANTRNRELFLGPREELNALLSDEAFANVPFLIFGITTAEPSSCPEEELCSLLDLTNITTGNGRVDLADANACPLEVIVAESYNKRQYLDGFKRLSKYIK
ncbi:gtp-binding protein sar1a [Quercus suber]|uniref:Gtp-binding protein sar1a n=1 Tax=Quercus suber TaxID=58331 RepID=A0AAW0LEY7_QUESU